MGVHRKTQHFWCTRKHAHIKDIAVFCNIFAITKTQTFTTANNTMFFGERLNGFLEPSESHEIQVICPWGSTDRNFVDY